MSRTIRTLTVSPQFLTWEPRTAGEIIATAVEEYPEDFWLVIVAEHDDAAKFMETHLWHYAPAKDVTP